MKIVLVQPALEPDRRWGRHPLQTMFRPAPITLPTIAACTPPGHDVRIVDDAFEAIPFDDDTIDVVGITGSTPFAVRMRQIADGFRARGRIVVVGGVYATLCPDDAKQFADAVVTGDAEDTWPAILADVARGTLQPFYRSTRPPLTGRPFPRRDLLTSWRYILPTSFQFTRGCIHSCDFCSINLQYGRQVRTTPIDAVIDGIRHARRHRIRPVMFWDDNIIGHPRYARELFKALKPLGKRWFSQATITIARSPELVRLAAESGCAGLFVGLESFRKSSLAETHKPFNHVERYKQDLRLLSDHGITIMSGLIFGFDEDTPSTFAETLEGAIEIGLSGVACSILTPYPGTGLYARMKAAGRLTTSDWSRYTSDEVVFTPRNLSPAQLIEGHNWVGQQFHSLPNILRRWWTTGFVQPQVFLLSNLANRRYFSSFPRVRRHPGRHFDWVPPPPAPPPDDGPRPRRLPVIGDGAPRV